MIKAVGRKIKLKKKTETNSRRKTYLFEDETTTHGHYRETSDTCKTVTDRLVETGKKPRDGTPVLLPRDRYSVC